jgi:hypothetical protein
MEPPPSPSASATGGQEGITVRNSSADELQDGAHHLLTVTCDDRGGLLADLSEHLRAHGVDVVSAAVATDTDSGHIVDSFAVRARSGGGRVMRARMCKGPRAGRAGAKSLRACAQPPARLRRAARTAHAHTRCAAGRRRQLAPLHAPRAGLHPKR